MRYSILDPTGNITALVESAVAVEEQPSVAFDIMRRHAKVEQVGFVQRPTRQAEPPHDVEPAIELRMAGGEFCGNASMCAAALYAMRRDESYGDASGEQPCKENVGWETVWLKVSGAAKLVEARICKDEEGVYTTQIHMPETACIEMREMSYGQAQGTLPVVVMEGISHIIIQEGSAFFGLSKLPFDAEQAVCTWCDTLQVDGLGLMFLESEGAHMRMTPLVYVPGSGTVFWENSCASGSAAAGSYLAHQVGSPISLALNEPGGILHVASDPVHGETWLQGSVRFEDCFKI